MRTTLTEILTKPDVLELAGSIQQAEEVLQKDPDNPIARRVRDQFVAEYRELVNEALHPAKLPPLN